MATELHESTVWLAQMVRAIGVGIVAIVVVALLLRAFCPHGN
jgi:hypothetical protein